MKLREISIKVENEEQSRELQELLFKDGCFWVDTGREHQSDLDGCYVDVGDKGALTYGSEPDYNRTVFAWEILEFLRQKHKPETTESVFAPFVGKKVKTKEEGEWRKVVAVMPEAPPHQRVAYLAEDGNVCLHPDKADFLLPEEYQEQIQVKPGKWRTRGGEIVAVVSKTGSPLYPWTGCGLDRGFFRSWTEKGACYLSSGSPEDLVEYLGPVTLGE